MISIKTTIENLGFNTEELSASTLSSVMTGAFHVAQATQAEWVRLAQARLKSSRETYVTGLQKAASFKVVETFSGIVFELTLIGEMANNLEFGMPSFDMKAVRPGWLGGGKAKIGKDGKRYITIPFRHSTSSNARLAYSGKAAKANLKAELVKTVKQFGMNKMVMDSHGRPAQGAVRRVPNLPKTGVIAARFRTASHHPLSGLTRIQKGRQGTLMTFRRMSENSPSSKWIHPGLPGVKLLPEVEKYAAEQLEKEMRKALGLK